LALLSEIADRTNRAVVVTDPDRRIVYINAAFTGMLHPCVETDGQRDLLAELGCDVVQAMVGTPGT